MSEPRRFGLWKRFKEDGFMVCHGDYDMTQLGPCDTAIKVVEAEPVLARINELEEAKEKQDKLIGELLGKYNKQVVKTAKLREQLKEANEVAEFYGKSRLYVNVGCEAELLDDRGSKARAYLKKWEGN